jgi:hypothetical protein
LTMVYEGGDVGRIGVPAYFFGKYGHQK